MAHIIAHACKEGLNFEKKCAAWREWGVAVIVTHAELCTEQAGSCLVANPLQIHSNIMTSKIEVNRRVTVACVQQAMGRDIGSNLVDTELRNHIMQFADAKASIKFTELAVNLKNTLT